MDPTNLALAFGSSFTAGIKIYMTVLVLGLMHRLGLVALPDHLQILANSWVIGVAGFLLIVEFVADKIPYVDNAWDSIHSFIRIPAGALLAAGAIGDDNQSLLIAAALAGGFISFTAHGAKASARLAVNASPEPFTNWFLSLFEDGLALFMLYLLANHPYIALSASLLFVLLCLGILFLFYRFLKMLFRSRREPALQRAS